jgi:HEAT repeat protein
MKIQIAASILGVAALSVAQSTESFRLGNQAIPVESPISAPASYAAETLSWSGWGPLKGTPAKIYFVPRASTQAFDAKLKLDAFPMRVKFYIYANVDGVTTGSSPRRFRRFNMEPIQIQAALRSIARLPAAVTAATEGRIKLIPEVEVFTEPLRVCTAPGKPLFVIDQTIGRINGSGYQAEDRIYRGPYASVMTIAPVPQQSTIGMVGANGPDDPLDALFASAIPFYSSRTLDQELWIKISGQLAPLLVDSNARAATMGELTTAQEIDRRLPVDRMYPVIGDPDPWWTESVKSTNVDLVPAVDPDAGTILRYREVGLGRFGGASLPVPGEGVKAISLRLRSKAPEPISLVIGTKDQRVVYTLSEIPGENPTGSTSLIDLPFKYDGTWQTITIPAVLNGQPITQLSIEPIDLSRRNGRRVIAPIEVDIAEIKASEGPVTTPLGAITPDAGSANAWARLLVAINPRLPEGQLIGLLKDADREVQFNAVSSIGSTDSKTVAEAVIGLANSIDPQVAEAAVRKYVELVGITVARPELVRVLKFGITDHVRGIAALELAKIGDPKLAGEIIVLLSNRSTATRLMAAKALGLLPGREVGIMRMAFIQQVDPAIKIAVTVTADPTQEYQMRKLLWSAVNEPSDDVRLVSGLKLIESENAEFRREGYKVIRDDAYGVRSRFAAALGQRADEAGREALLIAVVDTSPTVRAQAVTALGQLPKGIQAGEIDNLWTDADPRVQEALIALVKAKKLTATAAWLETLKKSPIPAIKLAADQLSSGENGGQ